MDKYIWGIDVGGTAVKIGLFSETGREIANFEIDTRKEDSGKNILPDIAKAVKEYMSREGISETEVLGIGLAIPGPVDAAGTIHKAVNLGWGVFNVEETMRDLTGLPVFAGNDANLAALGEMWQGAARGYLNAVMITLGTGIGGGVISEGSIICGHKGGAGELGHIHVEDNEEEMCTCGNYGCVEQYASATGLVRLARRILKEKDTASKLRSCVEITAKDIFDAAKEGDGPALEAVDLFGKYLGKAVGTAITILAPDVVVIGGGVSKAGSAVTDALERYYRDHTFHVCKDVPLVLAQLDNRAGMYGAARLVINKTPPFEPEREVR
ncbi:MAG: ROK family protein [Lachnospiraceae bacterium]|nr:ROK family protein [Lachnospiraceae bacterium]